MVEMVGSIDVGVKRDHNEDAIGLLPSHGLAVLADGMGGHNAGEVASALAVKTVEQTIRKKLDRIPHRHQDHESFLHDESLLLKQAVMEANRDIYDMAQKNPECSGMGTTLIAALFYDNRLTSAHVGDSRMYRLRDDYLSPVTEDHSLVQEQVRRGLVTPIDAQSSRVRNVVTRALGIAAQVEPDIIENETQAGDIYLMCSDGLTDVVPDEAIRLTLLEHRKHAEQAIQELINLAKDAGGPDNIAIILIRVDGPFERKRGMLARLGL